MIIIESERSALAETYCANLKVHQNRDPFSKSMIMTTAVMMGVSAKVKKSGATAL